MSAEEGFYSCEIIRWSRDNTFSRPTLWIKNRIPLHLQFNFPSKWCGKPQRGNPIHYPPHPSTLPNTPKERKEKKNALELFPGDLLPGIFILKTIFMASISLGVLSLLVHLSIYNRVMPLPPVPPRPLLSRPPACLPTTKTPPSDCQIKQVIYRGEAGIWQLSRRERGCPKKRGKDNGGGLILTFVDTSS